ncbi:response regulator transcription factor [Aerococcaceae bacterium INB8]|uniref:Response regulator transcription factor n=1 Tax=Ruoffia halotolerans TaxID=2748684 RepID=A0A839A506_9LACT|nr:response regulator transcription factor [Ruoffia halotolerans]
MIKGVNTLTTVMIIDDDPIVVESLSLIIENGGYEVIITGYSAEEAISNYSIYKPDITLLDIRMQEKSGIEAASTILSKFPQAKILLVTTFEDSDFIQAALQLGCKGYILKQNIKSILPAIEAVLNNQTVLDNTIVNNVAQSVSQSNQEILSELTPRELDIYQAVAEGLNNKEIAEKFYLSEGTIRNYISQLLLKLELRDRTQLAISYYKGNEFKEN